MIISLIAAMSDNNVIGRKGELPWHIPADLKRFATLTRGHSVIMGRKTYESIFSRLGKPLPDRTNIVITRNEKFESPGVIVVHSLDEALRAAEGDEIFVIGGAEIYVQSLSKADRLYLTHVHATIPDGDAFFPPIRETEWKITERQGGTAESSQPLSYEFVTYERAVAPASKEE